MAAAAGVAVAPMAVPHVWVAQVAHQLVIMAAAEEEAAATVVAAEVFEVRRAVMAAQVQVWSS